MKTLNTYLIAGKSLTEWHDYLTHDKDTGKDMGHLDCPGSRYGRTSDEVAWFALASAVVYFYEYPDEQMMGALLDEDMGYAVNDSSYIAGVIVDHWKEWLPACLRRQLGGKNAVKKLLP